MNTQEIVKTLETMANATWWQVLARQTAEADRLRRQADSFRQAAIRCQQQGDDATTLDGYAEESERQAEKLDSLVRAEWHRYWSAFQAVREVAPQLLGEFPIADGVAVDDIDPKAEARSITALIGKLVAIESDPWVRVEIIECRQDKSTLSRHARDTAKPWIKHGPRGWYDIRESRLPDYHK